MVCVIELFLLERRFNSKKNSNFSDSEIDKWSHNHFNLWSFTNFNSLSLTTVPRIWKQHRENREMLIWGRIQNLSVIVTLYSSRCFHLLCHATQTFKNNKSCMFLNRKVKFQGEILSLVFHISKLRSRLHC